MCLGHVIALSYGVMVLSFGSNGNTLCHSQKKICRKPVQAQVPWSLRPQNRAAAATCGHGRCELPAILRVTQKSLAASDFFAAAEAKNPAISAAEWLRAHLRPPWSLRFCDAGLTFNGSGRPCAWRESGWAGFP